MRWFDGCGNANLLAVALDLDVMAESLPAFDLVAKADVRLDVAGREYGLVILRRADFHHLLDEVFVAREAQAQRQEAEQGGG